MKYLVGIIKETEDLKGYGVFISLRHFLTVAQALTGGFTEYGQPVYVRKEDLKVETELHEHIVLNYETHPNRDASRYLNNIAVMLVCSYIKNLVVLTKYFNKF